MEPARGVSAETQRFRRTLDITSRAPTVLLLYYFIVILSKIGARERSLRRNIKVSAHPRHYVSGAYGSPPLLFYCYLVESWSPREESNLRPKHYECFALPTELHGPGVFLLLVNV